MTPLHSGEVQFVTFADSSKGGPRITLRLSDREELEAFVGMEGKRFMCALVLIGDDETAADPPANASTTPGAVHETAPDKPKGGELAKLAGIWCGDERFRVWMGEKFIRQGEAQDENATAQLVRHVCGVTTRAALDNDPDAALLFQRHIRGPYMRYLISIGATA